MLNIQLRDLIQDIVRNEVEETFGIACKVSRVYEDEELGWVCDCSPINGKADLTETRLMPEVDGQILIKPSIGSVVFVVLESESQAFVSMYGRIDSINYFDSKNGGVPIAQNITEKLNTLEDGLKNHVHTSASAGSPTTKPVGLTIENTKVEDLESKTFFH